MCGGGVCVCGVGVCRGGVCVCVCRMVCGVWVVVVVVMGRGMGWGWCGCGYSGWVCECVNGDGGHWVWDRCVFGVVGEFWTSGIEYMLILTLSMSTVCLSQFGLKVYWVSFGKHSLFYSNIFSFDTNVSFYYCLANNHIHPENKICKHVALCLHSMFLHNLQVSIRNS